MKRFLRLYNRTSHGRDLFNCKRCGREINKMSVVMLDLVLEEVYCLKCEKPKVVVEHKVGMDHE